MPYRSNEELVRYLLNPPSSTIDSKVELPDPVEWITKNFYIPEFDGKKSPPTIELYPYQKAVIREALRRDENGLFVYDLVVYSDLKKSAKSTIASAVLLYRAWHTRYGSFKIVANDLKQADSRVFFYLKRAIEMNDDLASKCSPKLYKILLPQSTTVEALPVDPAGEAGGGDDMIEFTELHASKSNAHVKMWAEMTLSPLKFGMSQRWVDTYAGYSGESPILEPLYMKLVKPENRFQIDDPDAPDDLEVYRLGRSFCLWNTKPRLPWQTPEYYQSESISVLPNDYLRMHKNEWSTSTAVFVDKAWWKACERDAVPELDQFRELEIALDAGVDNDCFGLIAVSRDGDEYVIRYAQKWTPPPHGKIDFADPERVLRMLIADYNVLEVCYDPYQLHDMCSRLADENIAAFFEFKQGAPRIIADKALRDIIQERRLLYDSTIAGIADVTEHILNANAKTDPLDPKQLRIVKRSPERKIDLAVCASMACNRAKEVLSP